MIALILAISLEVGVPGDFMVAIALTENPMLNPTAVNVNNNGTYDRGLMQLNSSWFNDPNWADPETNIRAACLHVKWLITAFHFNLWQTAIAYNAGYVSVLRGAPPNSSIDYANAVYRRYNAK
jgi:soluble lytic murein transglycosylase-like protein